MHAAAARHAYQSRGSPGRRIVSAVLALVLAAVLVLLLILAGVIPQVFVPVASRGLSTFDVRGERPTAASRPRATAERQVATRPPRTPPPAREPIRPVVPIETRPPTGMIVLSREDYASADIGRMKGSADAAGTATAAADSAAPYGPGEGPGGKRLYAAQWYREPTRAELAFYMPAGVPEGWGTIACRTVERYHVEDCRVLGESPGSGIGRAMRQAAWQFLVIPPRENGRPMTGAWVRIRYDIVRGLVK